ncbi:hypothetical protein JL720_9906 [Aureococcus anophagefferens]|nr:hypothetical protein JL720_9906 [Aureococcus anophagefferens]
MPQPQDAAHARSSKGKYSQVPRTDDDAKALELDAENPKSPREERPNFLSLMGLCLSTCLSGGALYAGLASSEQLAGMTPSFYADAAPSALGRAGEVHMSAYGVAVMLASEVFEAIKLITMQILLVDRKFGSVEGLFVMGPRAIVAPRSRDVRATLRITPLVRNFGVVIVSTWVVGDSHITDQEYAGFFFSVLGVAMYQHARKNPGIPGSLSRTSAASSPGGGVLILWDVKASSRMPPFWGGPPRDFTAVADAVDLPIVLYNVPGRTGVDMTVETTVKLSKHANAAGLGDATARTTAGPSGPSAARASASTRARTAWRGTT